MRAPGAGFCSPHWLLSTSQTLARLDPRGRAGVDPGSRAAEREKARKPGRRAAAVRGAEVGTRALVVVVVVVGGLGLSPLSWHPVFLLSPLPLVRQTHTQHRGAPSSPKLAKSKHFPLLLFFGRQCKNAGEHWKQIPPPCCPTCKCQMPSYPTAPYVSAPYCWLASPPPNSNLEPPPVSPLLRFFPRFASPCLARCSAAPMPLPQLRNFLERRSDPRSRPSIPPDPGAPRGDLGSPVGPPLCPTYACRRSGWRWCPGRCFAGPATPS